MIQLLKPYQMWKTRLINGSFQHPRRPRKKRKRPCPQTTLNYRSSNILEFQMTGTAWQKRSIKKQDVIITHSNAWEMGVTRSLQSLPNWGTISWNILTSGHSSAIYASRHLHWKRIWRDILKTFIMASQWKNNRLTSYCLCIHRSILMIYNQRKLKIRKTRK